MEDFDRRPVGDKLGRNCKYTIEVEVNETNGSSWRPFCAGQPDMDSLAWAGPSLSSKGSTEQKERIGTL